MPATPNQSQSEKLRIVKWLWAAHFFKARGLAMAAIETGKVLVNEGINRVSPAQSRLILYFSDFLSPPLAFGSTRLSNFIYAGTGDDYAFMPLIPT